MQYNQPFDQPNAPAAGYVNANPGTGIPGSIPPAAAFEFPQREIVNVVAAAGMVPNNGDLTQLLQACRSGVLDYIVDTGGTNALVITPLPVFLSLPAGTRFRIKAKGAPTAATALQVNNLAPIPVVKSGGNPLTGGEYGANDIISVAFDGVNFQLANAGASSVVLGANLTMLVPSVRYPTIRSALLVAAGFIILPGVYLTIAVAAGYTEYVTAATGPLYLTHPYGQRIKIVGAPLATALPGYADIAGMSNSQTLALYLARIPCRINAVGVNAIELHAGNLNSLCNFLVDGDQTNSGGHYGIKVGDWSTEVGMGAVGLLNVAVHGFGLDNIRAEQSSVIQAVNVTSTYSSAHAWHVSHGSVLEIPTGNMAAMYSQLGVVLQNIGQLAIDSASGTIDIAYNTGAGIGSPDYGVVNAYNATGLRIRNNGVNGVQMTDASTLVLQSNGGTVFSGNGGQDIYMANSSEALTFGCSLPAGSSPARGSVGNTGSAIY